MKTNLIMLLLAAAALRASAQDTTRVQQHHKANKHNPAPAAAAGNSEGVTTRLAHPLKTNDQFLPRFFIDLNYRTGTLQERYHMINLAKSYKNSLSTDAPTPAFTEGTAYGADLQLGWFFNRKRQLGLGT